MECPEFPKIPEICVKMIRRVNDEEGDVFSSVLFGVLNVTVEIATGDRLATVMCQ
jgi:hypothetical protein